MTRIVRPGRSLMWLNNLGLQIKAANITGSSGQVERHLGGSGRQMSAGAGCDKMSAA